jgi:hypothetical protein
MKKFILLLLLACHLHSFAQSPRWQFTPDGGITWKVNVLTFQTDHHTAQSLTDHHTLQSHTDHNTPQPHTDHIEMSGRRISAIITYGVDSAHQLVWRRQLVFPTLRTIPNNTHASLRNNFNENIIDSITADGQPLKETPLQFYINGYLQVISSTNTPIQIKRQIYPSTDKAACVERYLLTNTGTQAISLHIPAQNKQIHTDPAKGVYGSYTLTTQTYDHGDPILEPRDSYSFYIVISGRKTTEEPYYLSAGYEQEKREQLVNELKNKLILNTPNDTINRMFAFAKLRAAESIFDTKGGLMHGPGGGAYYAAIWANDQAEYVGPFFPFLGNVEANESARNCYRLFASYMNPEYKPIPSSIIAEGAGEWHGAGDRGDQAMIAYGASRFALAYADTAEAGKLWPLITWCLEYLQRKQTPDGVIASNSDELEGRFPAGKINLSTNVLAYGALISAAHLAKNLNKTTNYEQRAAQLKTAIDKYFGATIQGFDTYRYYDGNTTLRSWICLPLVMGIFDRKEETIKALLSKYLWSKNGILTESGSQTFWDRSTLYAFRGLFYAGATDTTLKYFSYYSAMRLLGEHVPYAVEAWPEGDQRHLSAESGLYCRTITEGLFGIEPTGFNTFTLQPGLPKGWDHMSLQHIRAFQKDFDITVTRDGQKEKIIITETQKPAKEYTWDGKNPLTITL